VILGESTPDCGVVIDTARGAAEPLRFERAPDCPFHAAITRITKIPMTSEATVGELRALLGGERRAIVFAPILQRLECPRGDYAEERWGEPFTRPCPSCGTLMRARTTLELEGAPESARLSDLGVAPREILAAASRDSMTYVELA
jgi:hypothetical protein